MERDILLRHDVEMSSRRDRKLLRKHFGNLAEAKTWREDANQAIRAGKLKAPVKTTVGEALDGYIAGMLDGTILDRSRKAYKPATCRSYERAAKLRIKPELGRWRLAELRRRDVQDFADRMRADGLSPSTIHNTLDPLRAVYRRALRRDVVALDPTDGLELPAVRGRRDRTAAPAEAEALIEALPQSEQATVGSRDLRRGPAAANFRSCAGTISTSSWASVESSVPGTTKAAVS
jgi:integrase